MFDPCTGLLVALSLDLSSGQDHEGLDWLIESVPGVPGEDYPIYAEVPDTGFTCDGQVEGGKYADPAAECQVHHSQNLRQIYCQQQQIFGILCKQIENESEHR